MILNVNMSTQRVYVKYVHHVLLGIQVTRVPAGYYI